MTTEKHLLGTAPMDKNCYVEIWECWPHGRPAEVTIQRKLVVLSANRKAVIVRQLDSMEK